MEQEYITIDIRTIFTLIWKNIILIIILALVGGIGTFLVSNYLIAPRYEAAVTLVVNTREEQTTVITNDQINSAKQLVNTYAVVLTNDSMLEEIISVLQLEDDVKSLKQRIAADAVEQTQVMRMTMRDINPHIAQAVLEEIMLRAPELLINTVKAGSVVTVSPPKVDLEPVSPRVALNTAIGVFAGIFAAMAYIFIKKAMANTFVSDEDIGTYLGLPVLGVIPSLKP